MGQLADVHKFIDLSNAAASLDDLKLLMENISFEMGFDHFALVQHVDVRRHDNSQVVWLENYPSSWASVFVANELYASDPIHLASQRTNVGFAWSDVSSLIRITPGHRRVLEAAGKEGVGDGFTVPAHVPGEFTGSCSFAIRAGRMLPRHNLSMAQLVGSFAFEAARKIARRTRTSAATKPRLTPRQVDCVVLVAKGKTDWEIGQLLGLTEGTVHDHIEEARKRYDVKRRVQLVLRAVHDGQVSLSDVIG